MSVALYRGHEAEGEMVYDEGGGGLFVVGRHRVGLGAEFEFVCDRPVVLARAVAPLAFGCVPAPCVFGTYVAPLGRRQRLMVNCVCKRWLW